MCQELEGVLSYVVLDMDIGPSGAETFWTDFSQVVTARFSGR
jgi:hypothetical protein